MTCGIILILIGVFALLESLGILPASTWDIIWPIILIILGLSIIIRPDGRYWRIGRRVKRAREEEKD